MQNRPINSEMCEYNLFDFWGIDIEFKPLLLYFGQNLVILRIQKIEKVNFVKVCLIL